MEKVTIRYNNIGIMKIRGILIQYVVILTIWTAAGCNNKSDMSNENHNKTVRLMTLNPGHFHAALIQKNVLDRVHKEVYVYAPEGPDLNLHLQRLEGFRTRVENPVNWQTIIYTGPDYLQRMLDEKPGNVMVTAGNNRLKTRYIYESVNSGIHVLSDKPMAIDISGWQLLSKAFDRAAENQVLLYDIMTERREVTSRLLRILMQERELFGDLITGTPDIPAIYKQSVHHLFKYVAGFPLRRPPWYFDVSQQGEGIVDVTVHLVDLSMWVAFPDQILRHQDDVTLLSARRWPTKVTREQFERITGVPEFPSYLAGQLDNEGILSLYSNGKIDYQLKGHHVSVEVQWDYEAPPGGNDSHFTIIRGTRAHLVVRQGEEQGYRATVYVEPAGGLTAADLEPSLSRVMVQLQNQYPNADYELSNNGWKLLIPDEFHYGHEAHFGMVAQTFFEYMDAGRLPEWEIVNMITKYYITTHALDMALKQQN
jgi:predicted dehydrogenase